MRAGAGVLLPVLLSVLALARPAHALDIKTIDVAHQGDRYTVAFDVRLDGDVATVRRLLTDYAHLDRLSDTVTQSTIVGGAPGSPRLALAIRACVLVFCRTLHKIEDVRADANGDIETRAVPDLSDFSYAIERWQISADGKTTRLRYAAQSIPKFFVPPVIGPLVIKYKIRQELRASAAKLEALVHTRAQQ
jgi:hypothetical protein